MNSNIGVPLLCFVLAGAAPCPCSAESSAGALLRERGLERTSEGVWVLAEEADLQRQWQELEEHAEAVEDLRAAVKTRIAENRRLWRSRQAVEQAYEKVKSQLDRDSPALARLKQQRDRLRRISWEPENLGEARDVQQRLVELTRLRQRVAVTTHRIRDLTAQLLERYHELQRDERLRAACKQLPKSQKLGPAHDYAQRLTRLGEIERSVLTPDQPLYRRGGQSRVGALLNGEHPVTFSWTQKESPLVLPASLVHAAGLAYNDDPPQTLRFSGGRKHRLKSVTLSSLRMGGVTVRNVHALVLPPEAEDLGARIGPATFSGYEIEPDPANLQLRFESAAPQRAP